MNKLNYLSKELYEAFHLRTSPGYQRRGFVRGNINELFKRTIF